MSEITTEVTHENNVTNQLALVKKTQESAITSIHENMTGLIEQANGITTIESKESFDIADTLRKTLKTTRLAVEAKRKELKAPILKAGEELDKFAKSLYEPLHEAENTIKKVTDKWNSDQKVLKEEKKKEEAKAQQAQEELEEKLRNLNGTLIKINEATTVDQIDEIEASLEDIDLKSFGKRSNEAGFIVSSLKMTCTMAKRALPTREGGDDAIAKNNSDGIEHVQSVGRALREEPTAEIKDLSKPENLEKVQEVLKDKTESDNGVMDFVKSETPLTLEPIEEVALEPKGLTIKNSKGDELDFGAVADSQKNPPDQIEESEEKKVEPENLGNYVMLHSIGGKKYYTPEYADKMMKGSVLPTSVYEGTNENAICQILTVDSYSKPYTENGLPKSIVVSVDKPNGEGVQDLGMYELVEVRDSVAVG